MPRCKLRVSGLAVTDSARFCSGGFNSFLGFEYLVLITLASHVFEYFLRFLLQACVICAFWLRLGSHAVPPLLPCLPSRFPHVRSLSWVFRLLSCWSGLQLRWRRSPRRLQRRFFCWLILLFLIIIIAQCGFVGGFLPNFAIFTLVSDHLRNFCFSSWDSFWPVQLPLFANSACLFTSLSLSLSSSV